MTLSSAAQTAILNQDTDEIFITLITVSHDDFTTNPLRYCNDVSGITSRGNYYVPTSVNVELVSIRDQELPTAQIVFYDPSLFVLRNVRQITSPVLITIEVVRTSDPDTVEFQLSNMRAETYPYSLRETRINLLPYDMHRKPSCISKFDRDFPGLWGSGGPDEVG